MRNVTSVCFASADFPSSSGNMWYAQGDVPLGKVRRPLGCQMPCLSVSLDRRLQTFAHEIDDVSRRKRASVSIQYSASGRASGWPDAEVWIGSPSSRKFGSECLFPIG